jgi:hypothetical protein
LWTKARKRYVKIWRNKWLTSKSTQLGQMRHDGVVLENDGVPDGNVRLVTTDANVAEKYGFVDESDYWDQGDEMDE